MNGVIKLGKKPAFQAHQMAHQLGVYPDCTQGKCLAVIQPAYYRKTYKRAVPKFAKFAKEVWGIREYKSDEEKALVGIGSSEGFIKEMGLPSGLEALA